MSLDLRSLIGRLNDTSRRALEAAAGLCVSRSHYEVEMEHWLTKLLDEDAAFCIEENVFWLFYQIHCLS